MIIISILFIVVLSLLFSSFSNNSQISLPNLANTNSQNSSIFTNNKTFGEDTPVQKILPSSITSKSSIPSGIGSAIKLSSTTSSLDLDDTVGKELKLPESSTLEYSFDSKDRVIIDKYIKTDYKNKIISKLKDDKNFEILVLKIPKNSIDTKTQTDFPKTFKFSNENRRSQTQDSVFLYYTKEKRIAFLGDYISSIFPFSFDSQDYWLIHYNTKLLISKPNFSNWSVINLEEASVLDVYKKDNFEFLILKQSEFGDILENRIEAISPQKYLIEGFFGSKDN